MSRPRLHIVATATILFLVWAETLLEVKAQNDAARCRNGCDFVNSFYVKIYGNSTSFLTSYLTSCYARCPPVTNNAQPPITTTTTTTTTTTPATFVHPGCGIQTMNRNRIVGGTDALECEFPWVVGISVGGGFCGGTILDNLHVLTAAHCLRDRRTGAIVDMAAVKVKVGSSLMSRLQVYNVSKMDVDQRHVRVINDYDVAVLTLATSLVFSECVSPICLPQAYDDPKRAEFCVAAGWGVEFQSSDKMTTNLKKVTLPVVDNSVCERSYGTRLVNLLKFCAGNYSNGGIDTCQGDSGGPLMCSIGNRYVVYGIVSFGSGCARAQYPGVYAYVAHPYILSYIKQVTGIN